MRAAGAEFVNDMDPLPLKMVNSPRKDQFLIVHYRNYISYTTYKNLSEGENEWHLSVFPVKFITKSSSVRNHTSDPQNRTTAKRESDLFNHECY